MKLFPFFLVNLAAFAVLHFAWIPSAERRLRVDRSMATIRRAGLLSILGLARSVFLVATLTTALLIVILFILSMQGGISVGEVTSAIETIHRWRTLLMSVGPVWGWIVLVLLVLSLGIYARRSGRRNMVQAFQKMYTRKFEGLRQDYELGKLKEMPPTLEMGDVAKKIGEINAALANLEGETAGEDPKTILMKEQLNEQITLLQKYYIALDMQRRIDPQLDPDEAALPEARTRWEKFQTFFISRGLLASLNGSSRAIFLASMILLVPSLISVYSVSTAAALNRHLVQLKDIRVELSRRDFEQEKSRLGQPTNDLSDEDKNDLQEVARNYEHTVSPLVIGTGIRASMNSMRLTLVREAILTRAAAKANGAKEQYASGAKWAQHASGSSVQELTALEREVVSAPEKTIKAHGPVTPQGQRVYSELEDIARRSPSFMEKVRTGLRSFQKPASSYDISHAVFNQMAGTLAGENSPELGNAIRGVTTNPRYAAFNGFTQMQSSEFLTDLMGGSSLDDAMRRTAAAESRYPFLGRLEKLEFHSTMRTVAQDLPLVSLNEKLAAYPPTVDVVPEEHVNMPKAVEAVDRYRNSVKNYLLRNSGGTADALGGFSDYFPAQVGVESETPRGKLLGRWQGRPPEIPKVKPRAGGSWWSFIRARAVDGLRGFSRVGGVLIGQMPKETAATTLNFADLRWEINESQVRFVLVGADGQQVRSRPYRTSIAYHALNYAADGRPLAVTMVTAEPLLELRILLHPTLVDTPLGNRIIELDRLVDRYTGDSQARIEAESRVRMHDLLYQFSWIVRALAYLDTRETNEGNSDQEIRDFQQELRDRIHNQGLRAAAREALKELPTIVDPQLSPLTVKKEFYDETLVEILVKSPPETTLDSLSETIRAKVAKAIEWENETEDKEIHQVLTQRWLSPPHDIVIWSGVRERDFGATPENILAADGASLTMPFNFMLQVSFDDDPNRESSADTKPWEFPALRDMIQDTVLENIDRDQQARTLVEDSAEFTMLQRLFRMALDGQLGENFPVEKMIELDQALSAGAPQTVTRTLRWHNRFGFDLTAAALEFKKGESGRSSREPSVLEGLLSVAGLLNRETEELMLLQDIRRELGVARDDEQARAQHNTPWPKLD